MTVKSQLGMCVQIICGFSCTPLISCSILPPISHCLDYCKLKAIAIFIIIAASCGLNVYPSKGYYWKLGSQSCGMK